MHVINSYPSPVDSYARSGGQPAADHSRHLGWFRLDFDDDRWTWSPQVERLHGYDPGTTAPSTLLTLSHVHPDDDRRVAATLYDVRRTQQPFSSHHRIIDTHHHVHNVVMIGVPFYDAHGTLAGLQGVYLDATPATAASDAQRRRVREATRC